jgi:hypothetical protein
MIDCALTISYLNNIWNFLFEIFKKFLLRYLIIFSYYNFLNNILITFFFIQILIICLSFLEYSQFQL